MTLTLAAMNPKKCACCWPLVNGCVRNCGPVVIDTGGAAPLLDDTYETCLTTQVAEWATLAFTDIAPGALADGVYASEIRYRAVSGWESCAWQVVAYCVADEAGNRGRKWVIELLFYNNIDGFSSITHEVLDWGCTCGGASFTFEGEGDIPECLTADDVDPDCPCANQCLSVTIPAITFTSGGVGCPACVFPGETLIGKKATGSCVWEKVTGTSTDFNMIYSPFFPGGNLWRLQITVRGPGPCARSASYHGPNCTGTFTRRIAESCSGPTFPSSITVTAVTCP